MNEAQLTEALRSQFGHAGFRPGQLEAVEAVVAGRDVLLVMPTGAGKSLGYQLPAILDRKLAVVVSPLVSLMTDQVESLGERAELINAQRDGADNRRALERAVAGEVAMLYVAPERFATPGFIDRLREAAIGLFVVDEAHCVSQWGHDFRPDYLRLGEVARALGARSIFAATATATPRVAADVAAAARASRPGPDHHRLRPPEPLLRRGQGRLRAGQAARRRWRCSRSPTRCRRSSTRAPGRRPRRPPRG